MEIALWEAKGDEGGVASVTVPDVKAEAERLRARGRRGRCDRRAARAGADRGRVRPGWEPHPVHRGSDVIRPAGSQDLPFLRDMLRHAYYARWGDEADVPLERYVAGWGRPGDFALVAIDEFQPVGAAWYRLFEQDEPGYGFVDPQTPELTIAIVPSRRGKGLGRDLLTKLLEQAREDGYRRGQPQRRARQPGAPPVRGARVHQGRRSRRRVRDARRAFLTAPRRSTLFGPMQCPACGTDNEPGRKFCGECGGALALACAACGTPNAPGVKFCGECGTPLGVGAVPAPAEREAPAAERRLVSVLFADLVGFTTLSESRDSEEVRELLSALLRALQAPDRSLRRHRREVHRRRGDGRVGDAGRDGG